MPYVHAKCSGDGVQLLALLRCVVTVRSEAYSDDHVRPNIFLA